MTGQQEIQLISIFLVLAGGYLLGSIPTSVWAGKLFHGIDIREHGSGNAGATNTIRVLGWKTGTPVLLIDLAKGWAAAMLPVFFSLAPGNSPLLVNLQILTGLGSIMGHVFPVFAGFRGGKGVSTIFGTFLAIDPLLTLSCMGVFLIVLLITGIVSISSMLAGIAFPLFLFVFFDTPSVIFRIFSLIVPVALVLTHRENIKRLLKGEEKRFLKKRT